MKRLLGLTLTVWLAFGATAAAQPYSQSEGTLDVDASTVEADDTVTVSGDGFTPDSEVEIVLTSGSDTVLATATADANGEISVEVAIPTGFTGDGVLFARGSSADGGTRVLGVRITNGALSQLAFTGASSNSIWFVVGALGLLAVGIGTLKVSAAARRSTG